MCNNKNYLELSASVWAFRFYTSKVICWMSKTWAIYKHLKTWKRSTCLIMHLSSSPHRMYLLVYAAYNSYISTTIRLASGKTCSLWQPYQMSFISLFLQIQLLRFPGTDTSSLTLFHASKLLTTMWSLMRSVSKMPRLVTASVDLTNIWNGTLLTIVMNLVLSCTSSTLKLTSIDLKDALSATVPQFWFKVCSVVTNRATFSSSTLSSALLMRFTFKGTFVAGCSVASSSRTWKTFSPTLVTRTSSSQPRKWREETWLASSSATCTAIGRKRRKRGWDWPPRSRSKPSTVVASWSIRVS